MYQMNLPFIKIATICLFFCFPIFSSNKFNPSVNNPLEPNILSCKNYSEIFTLTALCDDETFIQTQVIITNIGFGDSNAACEMLVLHPETTPYRTCKRFKKTCWKYLNAPSPTLAIGSCFLAQEGESTKCVVAIDSSMVEISLDRLPKVMRLLDTILDCSTSKKFYTNEVLIPWTRLRTTLQIPGCSKKQLTGFGMLEHSRTTGYPKDFSQRYISFYGCQAGNQFVANLHFPKNSGSSAVGWVWNGRDRLPMPVEGAQMLENAATFSSKDHCLPHIFKPHSSFSISGRQGLFRLTFLDELGPFLGNIVKVFAGNQVTCFFAASAQGTLGQPPIEGILVVTDFE